MKSQLGKLGSIISGTVRPEDTIPAMINTLWEYDSTSASALTAVWECDGWPMTRDANGNRDLDLSEQAIATRPKDAWELMEDLFSALQEIAPEDSYFGTHPGDGADLGFWGREK